VRRGLGGRWRAPAWGVVEDVGYHEILVARDYARFLMAGGMTHVNGEPVRLSVVCEFAEMGAVVVKVDLVGKVREHDPGAYSWRMEAA
jgi:hypothetical protein